AGIHPVRGHAGDWIPACAGMTKGLYSFSHGVELDPRLRGDDRGASRACRAPSRRGQPGSDFYLACSPTCPATPGPDRIVVGARK
ncbi:MAG: hypothetical protein M0Z94_13510, partial [Dehalococcoidales bacterium]|nr:hypothetical protein [Dehalococcoidales bacterium]